MSKDLYSRTTIRTMNQSKEKPTIEQKMSIKVACARLGVAEPKVESFWDAQMALDDLNRRERARRRSLSIKEQLEEIEKRKKESA